VGLLLEGPP